MDPNKKAIIDFELKEVQQKVSDILSDFIAGQEIDKTKDVFIKTRNMSEFKYRMSRTTDLLLEMVCYQLATIRVNGGSFNQDASERLVRDIMTNTDAIYKEMAQTKSAVENTQC